MKQRWGSKRVRAAIATVAIVSTASGGGTAASTPPGDSSGAIDRVRLAKIGLSWFLLDHLDRPTHISDPCPALSQESLANHIGALGLVPSARDYGPAVVFDDETGEGVAILRCGVDIARDADPPGSTAVSVDVFMLDGRATFDQYAVEIGGDDVVVESSSDPSGETAGRCTNGGRSCTWSINVEGLVVTVSATGLPAESSASLAGRLLVAVTPEVIGNLAAIASDAP